MYISPTNHERVFSQLDRMRYRLWRLPTSPTGKMLRFFLILIRKFSFWCFETNPVHHVVGGGADCWGAKHWEQLAGAAGNSIISLTGVTHAKVEAVEVVEVVEEEVMEQQQQPICQDFLHVGDEVEAFRSQTRTCKSY